MSVQRYATYTPGEIMCEHDEGEFVLHSDYAALEARCAGLERDRQVKDAYFEGFVDGESSHIGEPDEYWERSETRAALADTTNTGG